MSALLAVYRREMLSLWVTPLAWVLLTMFLLLQGGIFYSIVVHFSTLPEVGVLAGPLQAYFGEALFTALSLLLLCPALTMRTFAEERRSGTIETLLTAPVSTGAIVLGKYLALVSTFAAMWVPTLLYAVVLRDTGTVDWGVVAASYVGVLGTGAGYLALGVLTSAMSRSQFVALLLSSLLLFGLFVVGVGQFIFEPGPFYFLSQHVSLQTQLEELSRGIVDSRRLVFDATLVLLPLHLTTRVVDSWRWGS